MSFDFLSKDGFVQLESDQGGFWDFVLRRYYYSIEQEIET